MEPGRNPLVTIFIPTYNRAGYLDECLYSVLVQDYRDYEILIRDNASSDETPAIVKRYEPRFNHAAGLRYHRNERNVGFRDNMVHGLAECRGKYALILMDDDFLASRTAISSFVRALTATDKTSLVSAATATYVQGKEKLSPREIIDRANHNGSCASFSTIPGSHYFLNSWTRYYPLCLSSAMFDRLQLLDSPWAEWSRRAGLDVNIYHLLSLNRNVAIISQPLAYYRLHDTQDVRSFPVEDAFDSHSLIIKWYQYARINSGISKPSLFLWRLKTVILKDDGPIRWLHDRKPPQLDVFLGWLKKHSYLHYVVLRYLNPQMISYDSEAAKNDRFLLRPVREAGVLARKIVSRLIIITDCICHDPQFRSGIRRRLKHLMLGEGRG